MKSSNLITAQISSLIFLFLSLDGVFENSGSTFIFIVSFATLAICSIYINKHREELLKEIEDEYSKKEL